MRSTSILPETLTTFEYYRTLVPMYLRQDISFMSHFQMLYELGFKLAEPLACGPTVIAGNYLCGIATSSIWSTGDKLFKYLDIFNKLESDDDYLTIINAYDSGECDILDKLGALFGVSRSFSVKYNGDTYDLDLTDPDLLMLIKCQVIKNRYSGTYAETTRYYNMVGLPVLQLTNSSSAQTGFPAHCTLYMLLQSLDDVSDNIKHMFMAGLLNIESMGIFYTYTIQLATKIAIFDSTDSDEIFDEGQFIA